MMEQPDWTGNDQAGIKGSITVGDSYSQGFFNSGAEANLVFNAWDQIFIHTYNHSYCPPGDPEQTIPNGRPLPAYKFSFMVAGCIDTRWTIRKNEY